LTVYFIFSDATVHLNISYDTILLNEQETFAELIQNEDDGNYIYMKCCYYHSFICSDIQMLYVERTAIQTDIFLTPEAIEACKT